MEEKQGPKGTEVINIENEMQGAFLEYAMSVIASRALPDVRDGLKPVHRRVLFTQHELGNTHDKRYLKSARVVGDVLGKYHPHGDVPVYQALVRMAQDFSQRYTLVDGQGNFGSVDGDSAAAMRYTECRMSKYGGSLLTDIEKNTVNFVPNYDGSMNEPVVLPSQVPNLLVNGSSGIAVGMSTNIPPHNINEVLTACITLVDQPDVEIEKLMEIIPGPDLPTSGIISNIQGIRNAYRYGRGSFVMKGRADIEPFGKDKEAIIVTELPYQVNKANWIEGIANLVREKIISGISDIRDESDRKGMRVVIELKRGEQSNVILNTLYAKTQLKTSFGIIMLALDNGRPRLFNLKEALVAFIEHRKEIVTKRTLFELQKAQAREHILEGLKVALDHIDEVVEVIKKAPGPKEAKLRLNEKFSLSDIQAQAVLDMRLQKLTALETKKIIEELEHIKTLIAQFKVILGTDVELMKVIRKEFEETLSLFGDERKSEISLADEKDFRVEDFVRDEQVVVTITNAGFVKRNTVDSYRAQGRGGKGVKGAGLSAGLDDFVNDIFVTSTLSPILCFTNLGRVYVLKAHQIPEMSRTARGRPLVQLLPLVKGEEVLSVLPVVAFKDDQFVVMATKQGIVKKTSLKSFSNVRASGIIAITFDQGDSLIAADITSVEDDIFLASSHGQSIRFPESDIRAMGRTARGVRGLNLSKEDDVVVGMSILPKEKSSRGDYTILSVTSRGYGKRSCVDEYRQQGRAGSGIINVKINDKIGKVIGVKKVWTGDDVIVITNQGQLIRTSTDKISELGRATQGVRVINVKDEERVQAIAIVRDEDAEVDEPTIH